MAILISGHELSFSWPEQTVLAQETLSIFDGDAIGIVGSNGEGKSSLLEIIAGTLVPDSGSLSRRAHIEVALLSQKDAFSDDASLADVLFADQPDYLWASSARIRDILHNLLGDLELSRLVSSLSGGQRRKLDLARTLIENPEILALDEPTNHLDINTISWLAAYLKRWLSRKNTSSALVLVSHDRWFLDEVTSSMWELRSGSLHRFEGGYSAYIQQRLERERLGKRLAEQRQNALRRELAWLSRGPQARACKPKFRIKAAEELIADVPELRPSLELKKLSQQRLGKLVFELQDASLSRGNKTILSHLDFSFGAGDRVGLVGKNGTGKSSLAELLAQKISLDSGTLKTGSTVQLAYLSQNLDFLKDKLNFSLAEIISELKQHYLVEGRLRTPQQLLEALGITSRMQDMKLSALSGGQLRRFALLYVLLQAPNVLILDEPGNDLDTDMLSVLEDLLDTWAGTLILVSHDRYLLERACDELYLLEEGKLKHLVGGIDAYVSRMQSLSETSTKPARFVRAAPLTPATAVLSARASRSTPAASGEAGAGDFEGFSQKATKAAAPLSASENYRLKKELASVERKLKTAQGKLREIKAAMLALDPFDFEALAKKQSELSCAERRLSDLEELWLELSETVEA